MIYLRSILSDKSQAKIFIQIWTSTRLAPAKSKSILFAINYEKDIQNMAICYVC